MTYNVATAKKIINGVVRTVIYKNFWDAARKETRIRFMYFDGRIKTVECSSRKFYRKYIGATLNGVRNDVRQIVEVAGLDICNVGHSGFPMVDPVGHFVATPIKCYKFSNELPRTIIGYYRDEFSCVDEKLTIQYLGHYQ